MARSLRCFAGQQPQERYVDEVRDLPSAPTDGPDVLDLGSLLHLLDRCLSDASGRLALAVTS